MSRFLHKINRFSKFAPKLRQEFEQRFEDPKQTNSNRFVWDYWHVPGQYTLLRTPAYHYFTEKLYANFHESLVMWGRKNLGCWDISPPWLSCYVEGCKQEFHSDVPHGAWAYVYSLSPEKPIYSGGETLIMKPETLSYWRHFASSADREKSSFIETVPAKFNRLIAFDPRLPHSVSEVRGTHDPRHGRLVIHGWFTQPKTYLDGFLPEKAAEKILNQATNEVSQLVGLFDEKSPEAQGVQGTLAIGLQVKASGHVASVKLMTNTLISQDGLEPRELQNEILKVYRELQFPKAKGPTWLTVPLILAAE
ncbi:MAG: 2OG-Fe(II) oxygenase [Bdellovibrio sp.]